MKFWERLKFFFTKYDPTPHEDFGLSIYQENDMDIFSLACWETWPRDVSLWLDIFEALMAGRLCVSRVKCWSYRDERENGKKTEILYNKTFPMCYAQDHLPDHAAHTLLTDGWKEIYSVGVGIDRQMLETLYAGDQKSTGWSPYDCTPSFFALKSLPEPVTFDTIKKSTRQLRRYSMCYDSCEDWLDITLPDAETRDFVLKTIQETLSAHGKTLWVQGQDE